MIDKRILSVSNSACNFHAIRVIDVVRYHAYFGMLAHIERENSQTCNVHNTALYYHAFNIPNWNPCQEMKPLFGKEKCKISFNINGKCLIWNAGSMTWHQIPPINGSVSFRKWPFSWYLFHMSGYVVIQLVSQPGFWQANFCRI